MMMSCYINNVSVLFILLMSHAFQCPICFLLAVFSDIIIAHEELFNPYLYIFKELFQKSQPSIPFPNVWDPKKCKNLQRQKEQEFN